MAFVDELARQFHNYFKDRAERVDLVTPKFKITDEGVLKYFNKACLPIEIIPLGNNRVAIDVANYKDINKKKFKPSWEPLVDKAYINKLDVNNLPSFIRMDENRNFEIDVTNAPFEELDSNTRKRLDLLAEITADSLDVLKGKYTKFTRIEAIRNVFYQSEHKKSFKVKEIPQMPDDDFMMCQKMEEIAKGLLEVSGMESPAEFDSNEVVMYHIDFSWRENQEQKQEEKTL